MTAFTINTGAVVNWDTRTAGSVNATLDTYAISAGSTLLIDTDTYQCANHTTAFGSLDTVTFSGIGGTLKLDGSSVRVVAFTGGSGTVPAIGTTITQGGVSGYFLGVWANWQSEPLAAAAAMPATGFIKFKNKSGGSLAAGALVGITATASGPDVTGWIEVRGADTAQITVPRVGKVEVAGDWFYLTNTSGARGQIIPCPTTATVVGTFPAIQVETGVGTGVFEWYNSVGSKAASANTPTDSTRGKVFWHTLTGLRIGNDGTNAVGYLPPAGCRVRIPNIIMTTCTRTTSGSGLRVLPSTTLITRQEYVTTSSGAISIDKCVHQWAMSFSQAYSVSVTNSAINDTVYISEIPTPVVFTDNCVAPTQTQIQSTTGLYVITCQAGGLVARNRIARTSLATPGHYIMNAAYVKDFVVENNVFLSVINRTNATTGSVSTTMAVDCTFRNNTQIAGKILHSTATRPVHTGASYYIDHFEGLTTTTYPHPVVEGAVGTVGLLVDTAISFPVANAHPYPSLVSISACENTIVRNIGAFGSSLSLGTANQTAVILASGGNNSKVTLQRCYVSATRTGLHGLVNSDTGVIMESVFGDYADSTATAYLNGTAKGCGLTGTATGQVAVYGSHWQDQFTSATAGFVVLLGNEPTSLSSSQVSTVAGTPKWNSSGSLLPTTIGDQVIWEMPYFALGHTAFANIAPTINTATNLTVEYQLDEGAGYGGTWKTVNAANLSGEGAINPATGFKLKIRVTATATNAANILTTIRIPTITTSVAQGAALYPLAVATLTLTGLSPGSDIVVRVPGTSTIVFSADSLASPSAAISYDSGTLTSADVFVYKQGFIPWSIRGLTLTASGANIPVQQVADRAYL